jgi:hypothetical protein
LPALALLSRRLDLPMPGAGVSAALAHQAVIDPARAAASTAKRHLQVNT